jgi:hypothetical protein
MPALSENTIDSKNVEEQLNKSGAVLSPNPKGESL